MSSRRPGNYANHGVTEIDCSPGGADRFRVWRNCHRAGCLGSLIGCERTQLAAPSILRVSEKSGSVMARTGSSLDRVWKGPFANPRSPQPVCLSVFVATPFAETPRAVAGRAPGLAPGTPIVAPDAVTGTREKDREVEVGFLRSLGDFDLHVVDDNLRRDIGVSESGEVRRRFSLTNAAGGCCKRCRRSNTIRLPQTAQQTSGA